MNSIVEIYSLQMSFKVAAEEQLSPYIMDGVRFINGPHSRKSSKANAMPLTEYAANPIPPVNKSPASSQIPEAFLLPDGFPDVSEPLIYPCGLY